MTNHNQQPDGAKSPLAAYWKKLRSFIKDKLARSGNGSADNSFMTNSLKEIHQPIKITVVGSNKSGKDSLVFRYLRDEYRDAVANREDNIAGTNYTQKSWPVTMCGFKTQLELFVTTETDLESNLEKIFQHSPIFLLCFDISDQNCVRDIDTWVKKVDREGRDDKRIILVGCKADLKDGESEQHAAMQQYAERQGLPYIITSARDNHNVSQAFEMGGIEYLFHSLQLLSQSQYDAALKSIKNH